MAAPTKYRLAEEILRWLSGGSIPSAIDPSINEIKISIGQVCNQLLKTDYFQVNAQIGETIPNGSVLGLYEGLSVIKLSDFRSQVALPIKPLKLPRNMGVWSVFPYSEAIQSYDYVNEFIPIQMGQFNLMQSQSLLNDLLGQVGYENYGDKIIFTKNLLDIGIDTVGMRLVIMDISQYGDWDILPILPEMEWAIKQEVIKLYGGAPMPDKTVDPSVKSQKNIPIQQQTQA